MNSPAEEGESDHEISEILSDLDKILTDITAAGPAASDKLRAARDAAAEKAEAEEAAAKAAAEQAVVEQTAAREIEEAEDLAKIAAEKAAAAEQLAREAAERAAAQKDAAARKAAVERAAAEKAAAGKTAEKKVEADQAPPKPTAEGEKTVVLGPKEVEALKQKAPPAAPAAGFEEKPIPEKTPKEQVRRLAYLYSPQQAAGFSKCEQFIFQVAQKVSKRPIYVHTAIVLRIEPGMDSQQIVAAVKKAGAAGALALVEGMGDAQTRDIAETFDNEDVFYRVIPPADVGKRAMAIDLVVDMMLLKAG